jgi:hypothetical protein
VRFRKCAKARLRESQDCFNAVPCFADKLHCTSIAKDLTVRTVDGDLERARRRQQRADLVLLDVAPRVRLVGRAFERTRVRGEHRAEAPVATLSQPLAEQRPDAGQLAAGRWVRVPEALAKGARETHGGGGGGKAPNVRIEPARFPADKVDQRDLQMHACKDVRPCA